MWYGPWHTQQTGKQVVWLYPFFRWGLCMAESQEMSRGAGAQRRKRKIEKCHPEPPSFPSSGKEGSVAGQVEEKEKSGPCWS